VELNNSIKMKKRIAYALIGFFLPFVVAWIFVLLFGATAPNEYSQQGKQSMGVIMCTSAFVALMLSIDINKLP